MAVDVDLVVACIHLLYKGYFHLDTGEIITKDKCTKEEWEEMSDSNKYIPIPHISRLERKLMGRSFLREYVLKEYADDEEVVDLVKKFLQEKRVNMRNYEFYYWHLVMDELDISREERDYYYPKLEAMAVQWCKDHGLDYTLNRLF